MWTTAVGYAGGSTLNPGYDEVCGRADRPYRGRPRGLRPDVTSYEALLKIFWESHNPTQGTRSRVWSGRLRATSATTRAAS